MYQKKSKIIFPLLQNSFLSEFNKTSLILKMDIKKCFIDYKFNAIKTMNYLKNTK